MQETGTLQVFHSIKGKLVAEEINQNVVNVQVATDQSAAAIEQPSSSSLELAKLGEELRRQVRKFKI